MLMVSIRKSLESKACEITAAVIPSLRLLQDSLTWAWDHRTNEA